MNYAAALKSGLWELTGLHYAEMDTGYTLCGIWWYGQAMRGVGIRVTKVPAEVECSACLGRIQDKVVQALVQK